MVKKQYDKDMKLYLDIANELKINFHLTLLRYKEFYRIKFYTKELYSEYKNNKRNELNKLLKRLANRLNITTITDFL